MKFNDKLKLFTTAQVAEIFQVSKTQVQTWRRQGIIKPIDWPDTIKGRPRHKKFIRYSLDEVYRLLGKEVPEKNENSEPYFEGQKSWK